MSTEEETDQPAVPELLGGEFGPEGDRKRRLNIPDVGQPIKEEEREFNWDKKVKWPPEQCDDQRLKTYLRRSRESGDTFRANAYEAEIKRRAKLRNARSAIRAEAMDFLKMLYVIHEHHAEHLPPALVTDMRVLLVKHGIIVDPGTS